MDVVLLEQDCIDADRLGLVLEHAQCRLRTLFHHVAELASEDQPSVAGRARGLDEQDVAAHRCPGKARRHAGHAGAHRHVVLEADRSQQLLDVGRADLHPGRRALGHLHRDVAQRAADLALQPADAGLARVAPDDQLQRVVVDAGLFGREAVGFELAAHEIALGDLQLLARRVAGERDDLHAVAQRAGDRVQHVGGRDEDHAAQVERHVEIVVAERAVLLGVEYFEHRRRRIAVHAAAHLVDLVEHHHAVARAGLADRLDDRARQRADIGAPMAADLGLVMDAAQTHARELAAHGPGDRLAERGLADAWRSGEAQDRRLAFGRELAHGQILDDALLDLLEAEMIGVEHAPRLGDVDRLRLGQRPGQLDQRVEIGADHAVLGRRLGRALQTAQFLARGSLGLRRHLRLGDRLVEIGDRLLVGIVLAQLALDGGHLLAQHHLALAGVERTLGLLSDLAADAQHFQAPGQKLGHLVETRHEIERLQDLLLLAGLGIEIGGREIGEGAGRSRVLDGLPQLLRDLRQQFERVANLLLQHEEAGFDLRSARGRLDLVQAARQQERMSLDEVGDAEPLNALAHDVMVAVGRGHVTQDVRDRADRMEIGRDQLFLRGVALQHQQDLALFAHGLLDGGDRRGPADAHREHHLGEKHEVAHRHDDQRVGRQGLHVGLGLGFRAHGLHHVILRAHGCLRVLALARVTTRQPFASKRRTSPYTPGGRATRRSKRPCGNSMR